MKRVTITSTLLTLLAISAFVIFFGDDDCADCFAQNGMMFKFSIVGLIILIGTAYFTKVFTKTENEIFFIESLPLIETNEARNTLPFSGHGVIRATEEPLLKSPYSSTPCVYYHCIKEKYVRSGKNSKWQVVEDFLNHIPFYFEDDRGKLLVDITNFDNDFSGFKIKETWENRPDPDKSEVDAIMMMKKRASGPNERITEAVLIPGMKVFVHGYTDKVNDKLVLKESFDHPLIISQKTKEQFVAEFYKGKNLVYFAHFLTSVGFTVFLLAINYFTHFSDYLLFPLLTIGNAVIAGSVVFTMYNRMATLKQRALSAQSNIDIELTRRSNLIPQLEKIVKKYTSYEKTLQVNTTLARTSFVNKDGNKMNISKQLIAVAEKYPELKANETFNSLFLQLVDTEERIAYSRAFYNKNVSKLNVLESQFPFNIVAKFTNMKPMDFLSWV